MDNHYGYQMDHPLLKLLNPSDNHLTFKQAGDETIQEMWLKLQSVLQPCPSHGMIDKPLFECFYRGLGPKNISNVDQIFKGGMLHHPYDFVTKLLSGMVKTNKKVQKETRVGCISSSAGCFVQTSHGVGRQDIEKDEHFSLRECKQKKNHWGCSITKSSHSFNKK